MIDQRFTVKIHGKDFVTYHGLLDMAHTKGLRSITTELIQIPVEDNGHTAIVKATAVMNDERVFSDYGDASPSSVGEVQLVPHLIRMASTRAKARALRDAVNVGLCSIEELGSLQDDKLSITEDESTPATKQQIDAIQKLASKIGIKVDTETLTSANAGSMIMELSRKSSKVKRIK